MILSIESSCDDSAIALTRLDTGALLFHKRLSQTKEHSAYGGVVPELAARLHAVALPEILEEVKPYLSEVEAIAVTTEPGLTVTLVEGVMMAKALGLALEKPILPIHHIKGHIYSLFIGKEARLPLTALVASGGHTQVVRVEGYQKMETLLATMDDSLGESFDKVAKMLDLPYPGGPEVERLALEGDDRRFPFTEPLRRNPAMAFSYSGLKNGVRVAVEELGEGIAEQDKKDLCASFQKVAFDHIFHKLGKLFEEGAPERFAIVGGVSANNLFRERAREFCDRHGTELLLAPLEFCSDNAAMIGRAALEAWKEEAFAPRDTLEIRSRSPLESKETA